MVQLFLIPHFCGKYRAMPFKRILLYVWISLLLIIAVFLLIRNPKPSSGNTTQVDLPGKASAILYKEAKILSNVVEDDKVLLTVEGKLFIQVPPQEKYTYEIRTHEALISIVTGAGVIDASNEYTTELIVSEGQVSLSTVPDASKRRIRSIEIVSGEKGVISPNAKGVIKQNNRDKHFMAWVDFKLFFENKKIEDIISLLQDVYGVQIAMNVSNASRCRYTGTFDQMKLDEILEVIMNDIQLTAARNEKGQWEISGDGC